MANRTNEELARAAASGDTAAFEELVRKLEPRVAATVIGMLGRTPEAEDIGQETFIRFYKSLKDFRGECSVASYVTRIAINLSLNELKRKKRETNKVVTLDTEIAETAATTENATDAFENQELLQKALDELEPDYRTIVVLRLVEGYSVRETAEILKIPEGTVMSRLSRAQFKLKEVIEKLGGERR